MNYWEKSNPHTLHMRRYAQEFQSLITFFSTNLEERKDFMQSAVYTSVLFMQFAMRLKLFAIKIYNIL